MAEKLIVQSAPHIRSKVSTTSIMAMVIIALLPAGVASVVIFGWRALGLIGVCVASCVVFEYLCRKIMKRNNTIGDLSAVVTGLLLAYNLPVTLPYWMAVIGCFCAIVIVKQLFGGIGQNFVNPAIAARVILLVAFAQPMTSWVVPQFLGGGLDVVSSATPLRAAALNDVANMPSYYQLFWGLRAGSLGETCMPALLLGGIFLIATKVIKPTIPLVYLATVAVLTAVLGQDPLYHLMAGGVMLGAIFMATDYTTSPVTTKGKIIFAFGCGLLTVIIRLYGSYPEGTSFAILLMNIVAPLIDRYCVSHPFGARAKVKGGEANE